MRALRRAVPPRTDVTVNGRRLTNDGAGWLLAITSRVARGYMEPRGSANDQEEQSETVNSAIGSGPN